MIISKKKMTDLLSKGKCVLDEELSERLFGEVFQLPDGRILIKDENRGVIWNSKDQLLEILNSPSQSEHLLADYFSQFRSEDTFFSTYGHAGDILSHMLSVSIHNLDFSFDSLLLIDIAIKKVRSEKKKKDLFVPILYYVGETFRRQKKGDWSFVIDEGLGIVEPWFIVKGGRVEALFVDVFKNLFEPKYSKRSLVNCLPSTSERPD